MVDHVDRESSLYTRIGGEAGVRSLVDAFYDRIASDSPLLRALHPADDSGSRRKLFWFLSGWLGGPDLYVENRGHPRLRMRHLPFPIDDQVALDWLECMFAAMEDVGIEGADAEFLKGRFLQTAAHMRNR